MRGVTRGTTLRSHRGMLKGEWPGLRLVAAAAHLFLRERGAQFAIEIAAMLVMAVRTAHQLLFHAMMEWLPEFCLGLGMAFLAKLRLRGPQEELPLGLVMDGVAIQAGHFGYSMHGLLEVDRKSTRLNSSHIQKSRMPSSA